MFKNIEIEIAFKKAEMNAALIILLGSKHIPTSFPLVESVLEFIILILFETTQGYVFVPSTASKLTHYMNFRLKKIKIKANQCSVW